MRRSAPTSPRRCVMTLPIALALGLAACGTPPAAVTPRGADVVLVSESTTIEDQIPRHATMAGLLESHAIAPEVARDIVAATRTVFNPRLIRVGQPYRLVVGRTGAFQAFEYTIDNDRLLRVADEDPDPAGPLDAAIVDLPRTRTLAVIRGRIDADHPSLIAAVDAAGERVDLALRLADIFGSQVDFNADLQPDDRFELLFERDSRDGVLAGYGDIVAAALVTGDGRLQAFRFVDRDGKASYYDETGRSVRRFFLRSPLPFTPRVTSRFSRRRMHPVLGVPRAHLGVDYAAATGTPVLAVARGTVVSAGWSGGGGRMVRLRHSNGYETYYLHLSAIAKGLRPGARVAQGEVIGKVGSSGLATGPHLDYRLRKGGEFVDPLKEQRTLPPGEPVAPAQRAAFDAARQAALDRLQQAPAARPNTLVADSAEDVTPAAGLPARRAS